MGCFNTSCFATGQTIKPDERCYIIPIIQNIDYSPVKLHRKGKEYEAIAPWNSTCYPTAFWQPVDRPILCTYDDYGRVAVIETPKNINRIKNLLENGLSQWFEAEQGENECHDLPFKLSKIKTDSAAKVLKSFHYLWEATHESRVFWANYQGIPRLFTFAIISELAYNNIIDMMCKIKGWDGKTLNVKKSVDKIIVDSNGTMEAFEGFPEDLKSIRLSSLISMRLSEEYFRLESGVCPWHKELITIANLGIEAGSFESQRTVLEELTAEKFFHFGLSEFNIKYSPMVYASQDYSNEIGQNFKKLVVKTAAQIKKMHSKEDYE